VLVCKALKSGPCRHRSTISNTNSVRLPVYTLRFPAVSRLRRGKSKTPPACDWRAKQGALPNLGDIFAHGGGSKSPGVACACSYGLSRAWARLPTNEKAPAASAGPAHGSPRQGLSRASLRAGRTRSWARVQERVPALGPSPVRRADPGLESQVISTSRVKRSWRLTRPRSFSSIASSGTRPKCRKARRRIQRTSSPGAHHGTSANAAGGDSPTSPRTRISSRSRPPASSGRARLLLSRKERSAST